VKAQAVADLLDCCRLPCQPLLDFEKQPKLLSLAHSTTPCTTASFARTNLPRTFECTELAWRVTTFLSQLRCRYAPAVLISPTWTSLATATLADACIRGRDVRKSRCKARDS
jgi:hypothetical protein